MRRVLFLAYHFPPIGGAGVQRSIRFIRLLRDFGYEPVVGFEEGLQRTIDTLLDPEGGTR